MDKVEAFLQHYSSQYYDPVKAHEYYMRTRQLKGRTTSGMSDQQKEAWTYTKDQITKQKTEELKAVAIKQQQQIQNLRTRSASIRQSISTNLKSRTFTPAQKQDLKNKLDATINGVRDSFKKAKDELNAKYEQVYNDEYTKVMDNLPDKVKKTGKGRGKGSSRSHAPKYE